MKILGIQCERVVINARDRRGRDTGPWLIRWAINTPLGGVKLHKILRSDEDRDLHGHPWSFMSIILRGGYWEHVAVQPADDPKNDLRYWSGRPITDRTWFGPGSILWRRAPSPHRLELPEGQTAWTLVFTSRKKRTWGFRTVCGFIPWYRYDDAKAEGC
ncbi:MAG: hypothetical protein WD825_17210 [Gemmatimonadaceae bacterium]